ncbi:response regulator transcription factor [Desnuesiella massiliensis]|uniref:response regulator transcription factor n=1 Tax=Desnuesiella massiliensis TaxID=1650662 RepID=UPI0006E46D2A|nr:response regulator transcription factor [Desnuesiella massiliensis]
MHKINIAIADDEMLIREGLKIILGSDDNINIVGLCENGEEALELCKKEQIDVMLLDINMPVCNGVMATKLIKKECKNTKIMILTTFKDEEYIIDAIKFGAHGYILKDTSYDVILEGIKSVHKGNVVVHPEIAAKMVASKELSQEALTENIKAKYRITDRELEIIINIGLGLSNKEIAKKLFVAEGTVKNYITEILAKMELRDRTQLAIFALKNSLV